MQSLHSIRNNFGFHGAFFSSSCTADQSRRRQCSILPWFPKQAERGIEPCQPHLRRRGALCAPHTPSCAGGGEGEGQGRSPTPLASSAACSRHRGHWWRATAAGWQHQAAQAATRQRKAPDLPPQKLWSHPICFFLTAAANDNRSDQRGGGRASHKAGRHADRRPSRHCLLLQMHQIQDRPWLAHQTANCVSGLELRSICF
jgi:hypothetical protein